jgi:mercuric ion binding protein
MKTNIIIALALIILTANGIFAQITSSDTTEIKIKTTAVCGMCENKIESEVIKKPGVFAVSLDLQANIITVTYSKKMIAKNDILIFISKLGYAADDIPADMDSYNKLPACCQINSGIRMH